MNLVELTEFSESLTKSKSSIIIRSITYLTVELPRSSDKIFFATTSGNVSINRYGISLVTILFSILSRFIEFSKSDLGSLY